MLAGIHWQGGKIMQRSLKKQEINFLKFYKDGAFDDFTIIFTGRLVGQWIQDAGSESYPESETIYWRVYQLQSKKLAIFTDHRKNFSLESNPYIFDSVEEIENIKQIEGVSTDDLCRLIRESMTMQSGKHGAKHFII